MIEDSPSGSRSTKADPETEDFESEGETGSPRRKSGRGISEAQSAAIGGAVKQYLLDYYHLAKSILLHPRRFFLEDMEEEGGLQEPAYFLMVSAGINALIAGLSSFNPGLVVILFAVTVIGAFMSAVIANAMSTAWGGKGNFEKTFRVMAYSEAALAVAWVPVIGMLAMVYVCVLNFFGLRTVHQLDGLKTGIVVALSGVIALFAFLIAGCGVLARSLLHF
jgi:hypothetical protein